MSFKINYDEGKYKENNCDSYEEYKIIKQGLFNEYLSCLNNDRDFKEKLIFSLRCFDCFYKSHGNNDKIYTAFNGGKDCLAAYIIIKFYFYCKKLNLDFEDESSFSSFCKKENRDQINLSKFNVELVYFVNDKNYEEEEDYVKEFSKEENLEIFYLYSDYISGLKFLIKNFNLKSILMGTRKDDLLKSHKTVDESLIQTLIHTSTPPYPSFMRFYPIFAFGFHDIWKLILITNFEYLSLYDKGYSSIGRKDNTHVNEHLKFSEKLTLPAWCLEEAGSERKFRK